MEKINAAIVGLGRIASLLEEDNLREKPCTHAGAISASPDCALAAGCDIDEERRGLFARKWQVPIYADAAEMLRAHKPQILAIATHPDSHYHYCRLAADYGVKAVICEKPLADNIGEARKIARLVKNGFVIITNHERRYSQDYIRAKAVLDGGELGLLLSARAILYMGRTKKLLDVLWHDGTHLADAIMFLIGMTLTHKKRREAKLSAQTGTAWLEGALIEGQRPKGQTPAEGALTKGHTPEGQTPERKQLPVVIEIGAGRDHLVFEIEFSCEKGRLRIGNGVFEVWKSVPSPYAEKFRSLRQTDETFDGPTGYFANMVKDAAACVREPGKLPQSGAADGLRVIEYLNSIKKWR
jgi:predicted dehydrogenase